MTLRPRLYHLFLYLLVLAVGALAFAQTDTASLSGMITDPQGHAVPGVAVVVTSSDTNVSVQTVTTSAGVYYVAGLRPGHYRVTFTKQGFRRIDLTDLVLNVQDSLSRNLQLQVGSVETSITVSAEAPSVNTENATVSTVVDRQFLAEVPLNGRSIQSLLLLTPGVQLFSSGSTSSQGQFSVNGMRTDSNYFTIDGVAANLGTDMVGNGLPEASAGSVAGWNAAGSTSGLVSVDAIQEFRVQTSSFSPEYGRTPGAQVSIATRSGTNAWHGTAFEYLRNDVFDANDWFANHDGLPKAPERNNDFGGVFGGPIIKDRTFFFFSYEGMRLREPQTLQATVPDAAVRATIPAALQPIMNAYPMPNAPEIADNLAGFNASVSNPATMNAYSIRVDHSLSSKLRLFGRYAYSPSSGAEAGSPGAAGFLPNNLYQVSVTTHTATLGLDATITNHMSNEFRANYSNLKSQGTGLLTTLGGAVPLTPDALKSVIGPGVDPNAASFYFFLDDGSGYSYGPSGLSEQRQLNLVDNVSLAKGPHLLKFGVDFRHLAPFQGAMPYNEQVFFAGMNGFDGVLTGQSESVYISVFNGVSIRAENFSLYAQDSWKVNHRLTLTYGVRWDINPAPHGNSTANDPIVVQGLNDPATMTLAPRGRPFYPTTYTNFAPRGGIAFQLFEHPGRETVLRGGIGTFYDLGSGGLGEYTLGDPFRSSSSFYDANFPLTPAQLVTPVYDPSNPGEIFVAVPNLALPRTYQWNMAIEQSLGKAQTLSVTYLGTLGRNLLRAYSLSSPNPTFGYVSVAANTGVSNYQALQVKFQRQLSHGLQVLAQYSYSHSIDNASDNQGTYSPSVIGTPSIDRGNSDFDVRHSMSGALTYAIPGPAGHGVLHALGANWSVDDFLVARTAFPVNIRSFFDSASIGPYRFTSRPNIIPGQPFYLYGSQYPGGKSFNPAAFADPPVGTEGNLGRNTLRGFGAWQDNFAIHRVFKLYERVHLQFRAEAFNILNHPNFADPYYFWPYDWPEFGVSQSSLANGLGSFIGGGLNPIYQIGAPRSWQFGLKLEF